MEKRTEGTMQFTEHGKAEPTNRKIVYDGKSETFDIVSPAPDMAAELDSLEDIIRERLSLNQPIDDILRDLLEEQVEEERGKIFSEVLIKILLLIANSTNPKLEIEVLIQAANLSSLREGLSHRYIAEELCGVSRQVFSARVQKVIKELNLKNPRACKSEEAKDKYRRGNQRKYDL